MKRVSVGYPEAAPLALGTRLIAGLRRRSRGHGSERGACTSEQRQRSPVLPGRSSERRPQSAAVTTHSDGQNRRPALTPPRPAGRSRHRSRSQPATHGRCRGRGRGRPRARAAPRPRQVASQVSMARHTAEADGGTASSAGQSGRAGSGKACRVWYRHRHTSQHRLMTCSGISCKPSEGRKSYSSFGKIKLKC